MSTMKRLILTSSDSGAGALKDARIANCVIPFGSRLVWGQLPSQIELETMLSSRSAMHQASGSHWLDHLSDKRLEEARTEGLGLIEFCERFEAVELWIDPDPNSQLTLIWLLDYFRHHGKAASNLMLVQADVRIGDHRPEEVAMWRPPAVKILNGHLEIASTAWQAYRESTPRQWFNLLGRDLSVLPQLRQTVLEILEELPASATGLGSTEMLMLKLISAGNAYPSDVFPGDRKRNQRRVFGYWEVGCLLDGLAHCPAPAVSGLGDGPFTIEMHDDRSRYERYLESRLSLTALGEAILARTDDFSLHNPIDRWWGGTKLTNDRLWRWDPATRALIAP
jgi:hypothetical protein